jgi:hypothetical protein
MLERIRSEWKKPLPERMKSLLNFPFSKGVSHKYNVFLGYQPDAYATFNAHPEFVSLFEKFSKHNSLNNAGDIARLWSMMLNIKQVIADGIEGDFAELGVWRGNTAAVLAHYAANSGRKVFLFDTFQGFDSKDLKGIDETQQMQFADTSVDLVKEVIGTNSDVCEFERGYFPDSLRADHADKNYAVVSLDCDLYEPIKAGLNFFYPRMPRGALFLLHDYSSMWWPGAKQAIDEFCKETQENIILMPDKSGSAFLRKSR